MSPIRLSSAEREKLLKLMREDGNAKVARRARALLSLDRGEHPREVAESLGVSRSTVYEWAQRYREGKSTSLRVRLEDQPRPGRPPVVRRQVKAVLPDVLEDDPTDHGYGAQEWTIILLQSHLQEEHGLTASRETIRRAMKDLDA